MGFYRNDKWVPDPPGLREKQYRDIIERLQTENDNLRENYEIMGNFIKALVATTHDDDFAMEGKEILRKVGLIAAQEKG